MKNETTTDYLLIEVPHQFPATVTYMSGAEIIDYARRDYCETDNYTGENAENIGLAVDDYGDAIIDTVDDAVLWLGHDLHDCRAVPVDEAAEYLKGLRLGHQDLRVQALGEKLLLENGVAVTPEQIKAIRERYGWNAAELGEELGVSGRTVEGWEQGRPVPATAVKLMSKLI